MSRHARALAAARPLWLPPPILIAVCIGIGFWWIAALGTAVCALACLILYGIAGRARDDIRLLDGTVGILIPDDLVHLHLARRYWVRGDMPLWRDNAERLPVIAKEVSKVVIPELPNKGRRSTSPRGLFIVKRNVPSRYGGVMNARRRSAVRTEAIMQTALDLALEVGYAKLSMEAVASRAGVGKDTIYRRWPSKALLFLDAVLSSRTTGLEHPYTDDIVADLREVMTRAVDLLARPPWGPLYRDLIGEAQHNPEVAAALNERFIQPQTADTLARLKVAKEQGQLAPDFDLDLAFEVLSGPLYYRLLITHEPLTPDYLDRVLQAVFVGMGPRPRS